MTNAANMEGQALGQGVPQEGATLPALAWTFDAVQDRLVEAMIVCWRDADRERGWMRVRSTWPEISRDQMEGDSDARGGHGLGIEPVIRPAALTRRDVAEMEEAFGWMDAVEPDERKIVGLAVMHLARGAREVPWIRMLKQLGVRHGAHGLRKRYGRAIADVAARLRMRYRTDVTPAMRFIVDGREKYIVSGPAELGRREALEFMVAEYMPRGNLA